MINFLKRITFIAAAAIFLFSCKKKFDDYYERPPGLEPPIYQQLQARGNFTNLVSLIDKSGYKSTLAAAGYWTMFAPSDSAFTNDASFTAYLQSKGFANVAAVDSATAQSIVQYLLVFNAFEKDRLDDFQSNIGWVVNSAFKRRTAYYTGFYNDTSYTGQAYKAIQSNRNNNGLANSYYNNADNNNKHIPFFTSDFFAAKGLTAADYNYFYPGSSYTGFNIDKAAVSEQDIAAENGVIHVINKVVTPLMSLDQYLRNKPEYSLFRSLYERFMVLFLQNADASRRYQVLTGNTSVNVYTKVYSNLLAFALNSENSFKLQDNDAQKDGWTLFVPKNDSLQRYIDRVLLESYPSVNSLPLNIIADLLNAHMWQTTVWPSKFASTYNFLGEPAKMNSATNIIEKKVLSNGLFYGTDKVNEPNVFASVYGRAYLNPNFSLMTRLLDFELKNVLTNPNGKYAVLMIPDAVFAAKGYSYNPASNGWTYFPPGGTSSTNDSNRLNLLRMINTCVIETPNNELANLGNVGFSGITSTYGGECIKYNGTQIITAGTIDRNITVRIDSSKTAINGKVYYLNDLPYFTYTPIVRHIRILGTPPTSEFNLFWNYLRNYLLLQVTDTLTIPGTSAGSFYTIFIPTNTQMRAAITAGLLPGTAAVPLFNPPLAADKIKVEKFIQYHILDKRTVIPDNKDIGLFPSILKSAVGDPVNFTIQYTGGVFEVKDQFNRIARLVTAQSNQLSNRTVIHSIDNYLKNN